MGILTVTLEFPENLGQPVIKEFRKEVCAASSFPYYPLVFSETKIFLSETPEKVEWSEIGDLTNWSDDRA